MNKKTCTNTLTVALRARKNESETDMRKHNLIYVNFIFGLLTFAKIGSRGMKVNKHHEDWQFV